jgi:hypothetical protein
MLQNSHSKEKCRIKNLEWFSQQNLHASMHNVVYKRMLTRNHFVVPTLVQLGVSLIIDYIDQSLF